MADAESVTVTKSKEKNDLLIRLYHAEYSRLVKLVFLVVGSSQSAEEIAQDAFVKLHTTKLPPEKGKEPQWLRSVALNSARTKLRRQKVAAKFLRKNQTLENIFEEDSGTKNVATRLELLTHLQTLSSRQREVLALQYYLGLNEAETAEALNISPGSIKTHKSRALKKLRQLIGGQ